VYGIERPDAGLVDDCLCLAHHLVSYLNQIPKRSIAPDAGNDLLKALLREVASCSAADKRGHHLHRCNR
jgi:hypothetical protein